MSNSPSPVFGLVLEFQNNTGADVKVPIGPASLAEVKQNGLEVSWPAKGDKAAAPIKIIDGGAIAELTAKLAKWAGDPHLQLNMKDLPDPLSSIGDKLKKIEVDLVRIHIKVPPNSYLLLPTGTAAAAMPKGATYTTTQGTKTVTATVTELSTDNTKAYVKLDTADGALEPGKSYEFKMGTNPGATPPPTLEGVWTGKLLYTFTVQVIDSTTTSANLVSVGGIGVKSVLLGVTNEPPASA